MHQNYKSLVFITLAVLVFATAGLYAQTTVTGTGTTDRIVRWANTTGGVADSIMWESNSRIGVGTTAAPVNRLHVFSTSNADGVAVDGTYNPAVTFRNNGTAAGYLGLATVAGGYFTNSQVGDVALRSETGNVLLGRAGMPATMAIVGSSVGIGTASPTGQLHIYSAATGDAIAGAGVDMVNGPAFNFGYAGNSLGRSVGFLNVRADASATAPNPSLRFMTANLQRVIITNTGAVGIGTMDPEAGLSSGQESPLHVYSNADKNTIMKLENVFAGVNSVAAFQTNSNAASISYLSHSSARTVSRYGITLGGWNEIFSWGTSNGLIVGTGTPTPIVFGTNNVSRMTIDSSGNFTIGSTAANSNVTINGTLTAVKVIGAVYQDVAEWVPATTKMEPGTVVVLNRDRNNEVMPSAHAYDTAVAGVVSAQPGLILGVASDSKAQIATTGRVKVHVDASTGAIAVGDLLVTSDKQGTAMKSKPVDLGGVQFHRPGTVVGKALEPLPDGEGEILVLLSLQ